MQLSSLRKQLGQGMTEYIIIVALIAVAAIGVFQYFGQTARSQAAAAAQQLAGEDGSGATATAVEAAGNAVKEGSEDKNMGNFTDNEQ